MISNEVNFRANQFVLKNLVWFLIIAFGWSWSINSLFTSGLLELPADLGTANMDIASVGLILLILIIMPFGPTISAFIIIGKTEGRNGVSSLWKRFWNRQITAEWLLTTLLFFPMYFLLVRFSAFILSIEQPAFWIFREPWLFVPPFLASILHGGLSEEFGWRGYALTNLQAKLDATSSSITLGVIEGIWHIPLAFMPGYAGWEGRALIVFFVFWIPVSISRTWIFNNSNGSVLAASLFHAMGNTATILVPINVVELIPSDMGYIYLTLVYIPVVVTIVLLFGYKTLVRSPRTQNNVSQYVHMYLDALTSIFRRNKTIKTSLNTPTVDGNLKRSAANSPETSLKHSWGDVT
ncbi:MAG: CPBP family intramembrane glutamic endopeptidase [Candidatus Thorarchaeota archaeon]